MWQEMNLHDVSESYLQRHQTLRADAERRTGQLHAAGDQLMGPVQAIRAWLASLYAARQAPMRPALNQPCLQESQASDCVAAI